MTIQTYELIENGTAIRCLVCMSDSYNPAAIEDRVCPQCGVKHDELANRIARASRLAAKRDQAERLMRRFS